MRFRKSTIEACKILCNRFDFQAIRQKGSHLLVSSYNQESMYKRVIEMYKEYKNTDDWVRKKLGIKDGNVFTITEKKGLIVLKKLSQGLTTDDIKTLQSIQQAWNEIEHGKGGTAKASEFFKEFAKW